MYVLETGARETSMRRGLHKQERRSVRLEGYDYSQEGAYLLTICTRDRILLFENEGMGFGS
jgi:hypothetical protein